MTFVFLHLFCHKSPAKIELLQALPKAASSLLPFSGPEGHWVPAAQGGD